MAAHSNMRTYYFCCDTSKEMDIWMRVMTAASLVHSQPAKRTDITKLDHPPPQEINHVANQRLLIRPETNNNQKNQEMMINRGDEKVFREAEKYGFQKDGQERPLTKISSVKHHSYISDYDFLAANTAQYRATHVNGPESRLHDGQGHLSEMDFRGHQRSVVSQQVETDRAIQRTNSMLQLEQWIRTQREKSPEEDTGGVMSYQTLPRNMPSYRAPVVPRYPEGYKTLPRNLKTRPDSVCSTTGMLYERTLVPVTAPLEEKRRSVRDDTMWQLYEWQQRQFYNKQSTLRRHSSLTSPKTMVHISDQTLHSIPMSPSHGSISGYHTYSPHRAYRSEVSSPVQRGDLTIERRQKPQSNKLAFAAERRSVPAGLSVQPITPQGLQGKTMTQDDCRTTVYKHRTEELDIDAKLSRLCEQDKAVQALEQKLQQLHKEKYTLEQALLSASQEIEMNTDNPATVQSVVLQRDELQSGLLSTCREVSRATAELERSWREYDKLERDVTTARNQMRERLERLGEVQTESAGIQRAQMQKEIWRIQDVVEGLSKHKQQRPQTDNSDPKLLSSGMSPGEEEELVPPRPPLPRSYDIADAAPSLPHLPSDSSSSLLCYSRGPVHLPDDKSTHHVQIYQRNGSYSGPDYRLYKSEPELTTVAEVDESNGEDKAELMLDMGAAANKGSNFPVGVVPPRTKSPQMESSTIASYVTLRKNKKLDTKSERPRSAVEHLCLTESPRPRMTLEEQLERMRRHQAACLKEKKKGFSFLGSSDQSPSRSPSFSGENSVKLVQLQKKEEKIFSNIKDMENVVQERNTESSAQDVSRLKEVTELQSSPAICDKESGDVVTTEKSPAHEAKDDRAETSNTTPETLGNCLQVLASVPKHKSESGESVSSTAREAECSGILFSYDFSADTLRRQTVLDAGNLPSLPEAQELPVQPQLTEGSHFMCV
ncbi:pleckstrin homology domain-containing family A member 5 isoform X6 [Bufo bufo]|uniref:pleckstrin homology domain-containing family A member 5 isoform X6 n=1 Tax=Bufo bufo TaxID=8384 RepID=UPI001ABEDDC4|nr:pleckstrin homology domain-containing family A member 5 isoform X6 [Bufo bufo]